MVDLRRRYGHRLGFCGNSDVTVWETGDRAAIRREVITFLEGLKAREARFVFASDHSLSTNIAYRDYRYALEVYREHMLY